PQTVLDSVLENLNQAQQQIAVFQGQVKVQQDALLVASELTDLPEPDSPTIPTTSPCFTL
ncbi:hypothetical protein, partial [Escherichia coli]|uniref:hypothetical protein n=1 Tax=Escherichia coli TaxID=562 RepID=UPI001BFC4F5A